ncbi:MAG: hypothetical protein AAF481_11265 [Acidobacteriota bacterium]
MPSATAEKAPNNAKTPQPKPEATKERLANAFHPRFLAWLDQLELPPTSGEAAHRGPWKVEPTGEPPNERFAVLRQGESLAEGDLPRLLLTDRQDALLAAAALPAMGRADAYRLGGEPTISPHPLTAGTYPLLREGQLAGHCRSFDAELAPYLHALRTLCSHPEALAHLLEAAGHEGLVRAGRVLARRVEKGDLVGV